MKRILKYLFLLAWIVYNPAVSAEVGIFSKSKEAIPSDALGQIVTPDGKGGMKFSGKSTSPDLQVKVRRSHAHFTSAFWQSTKDMGIDLRVKARYLAYSASGHFSTRKQEENSGNTVSFTAVEMVEFDEERAAPPETGRGFYVSAIRRAALANLEFKYTFSSPSAARQFKAGVGGGWMSVKGAASTFQKASSLDENVSLEVDISYVGEQVIERNFFDDDDVGKFNAAKAMAELDRWQKSINSRTSPRSLIVVGITVSPFGAPHHRSQPDELIACYQRLYAVRGLLQGNRELRLSDNEYDALEREAGKLEDYLWLGGEDRQWRRGPYRDLPLRQDIASLEPFWLARNAGTVMDTWALPWIGWGFYGYSSPEGIGEGGEWLTGQGHYFPNLKWTTTWNVVEKIEIRLGGTVIATLRSPDDFRQIEESGLPQLRARPAGPGHEYPGGIIYIHYPEGRENFEANLSKHITYGSQTVAQATQNQHSLLTTTITYVDGSTGPLRIRD